LSKKKELLSIGEMSKFTGVGIQALRYYERKNILKPAYIDPDSGYRYYSFEQANSIDVITACVELDIPLKELVDLFETEDFALLQRFFIRNKEAAERKLKAIKTMIRLADKALDRMETNKSYAIGEIYKRTFPEKVYYVKLCGQTLENVNRTKVLIEFAEEAKADLRKHIDIGCIDESMVLMEYGFLCKYSGAEVEYFTFAEVPKGLENERTITIRPNSYHFRKDKISAIKNAPDIFNQYIGDSENFMIIEVEEIISGKSKINEPIYELRLVMAEVYENRR
jgi:DNA-binding transcriptional MerR regulator